MTTKKSFFISTAIPYVNAKPHVGHVLEFIEADAWARFQRSLGYDVFFATGTDENALKNVQAAEIAGTPIKKFVEDHANAFQDLAKLYNVAYSDFIRTATEERHIKGAKKLWKLLKEADIYKKKYEGLYCVGCESFKNKKDLVGKRCPDHPSGDLDHVEEENYFFRLSNYAEKLEELIVSKKLLITPESKQNEILSFIKSGLEDLSISRSRKRAKSWGIPVPEDEDQIMYVWVDALSNYINILDYANDGEKYKTYWQNAEKIVHVVGKDINRFHTIYWPIFLLSAEIRLPDEVFVHGFITLEGKKMSKSTGNVIDPSKLVKGYGVDPVRYYLLREIPAYDDGDFSKERFIERYNADLSNGLGNFASRILTLAEKLKNLNTETNALDPLLIKEVEKTKSLVMEKMNHFKFNEALVAIWQLITIGDQYLNNNKPWETKDPKIISNLVALLEKVATLTRPFLPESSAKILASIKRSGNKTITSKIPPLFPRI